MSRREWARRAAMVMLSPLLMLAIAEYVLWMFDVAPPGTAKGAKAASALRYDEPMAADASRVVCLGGSSMAGEPFIGQHGMCGLIAEAADMHHKNLAAPALDSVDVLARGTAACANTQGLVVVYAGHNEFLNLRRFHLGKPPELALSASGWLGRFRFYRLIQATLARPAERSSDAGEPELTDTQVYDRYEQNLRSLLTACKGRPLVLSKVIANQEMGFPAGGHTLRETWRLGGGFKPVRSTRTCRNCFRAGPEINDILEKLAAEFDVPLADPTELLRDASGHDLFWDHCHPRPDVHVAIAERIVNVAHRRGLLPRPPRTVRSRLSQEQLQAAELARAIYVVQFDPVEGLRRLQTLEGGGISADLARVVATFVTDNRPALVSALQALGETSQRPDSGLKGCLGESDNGLLSCAEWRSAVVMNEAEQEELVRIAQPHVPPLALELLRTF